MGVLDKFLDAIKLNDDYDDDGFLDDDLLDEEEDDDFLDDDFDEKPKKKFFEKFSKRRLLAGSERLCVRLVSGKGETHLIPPGKGVKRWI